MDSVLFWSSYIALWLFSLGLAAAIFFVYRYLGGIWLNSAEGRSKQGPEIDARLPSARLRDVNGAVLQIGQSPTRPLFLFFASTTCGPCERALEAFGNFARDHQDALDTALVCRGANAREVAEFARNLPPSVRVIPDTRWELGSRLHVSGTPFAVITDESAIVRGTGMPDSAEAFEWFYEQLQVAAGTRPHSVQFDTSTPAVEVGRR